MADLGERGIDVWDRDLLRSRPWTWLETHIVGLLAADSRLYRAVVMPPSDLPKMPD